MVMKRLIWTFFLLATAFCSYAQKGFILIANGQGTSLHYSGTTPLVKTAVGLVIEDSKSVADQPFRLTDKPKSGSVVIGIPGESKTFDQLLSKHQIDISDIGIYIGSSHCEPLARNSATEWDIVGEGRYNYITNKDNVLSYWTDRLKELGNSNNIFTMGMRGKHDGAMEGVKGVAEYKEALDKVLIDQTQLLKTYINPDPSQIPQVVIPYKEILDVYRAGLKVPDYVTLMWCDDNYGYITHFPDAEERQRPGGNGIYYHISYWGRPHDHLWLSTMSPALIHQQMKTAYEHDVRKIWIVNVGDIKPGEYQTELF